MRLTGIDAVADTDAFAVRVVLTEPVAERLLVGVCVARDDSVACAEFVALFEGVGLAVAAEDLVVVRVRVVVAEAGAEAEIDTVPLSVPVEEIVGLTVREGVLEPVTDREDETVRDVELVVVPVRVVDTDLVCVDEPDGVRVG